MKFVDWSIMSSKWDDKIIESVARSIRCNDDRRIRPVVLLCRIEGAMRARLQRRARSYTGEQNHRICFRNDKY